MDSHIEETLSLSPLYVTLTDDEKNCLINKINSQLVEYTPDSEIAASDFINL